MTELLVQDRQQRLVEERRQVALGAAVQCAKPRQAIVHWLGRLFAAPRGFVRQGTVRPI